MELCTLFSGSSGNACLIRCGDTQLLVDAGVSAKRLVGALRNLDVDPGELSGILVTHEHIDHIRGIDVLSKSYNLPVYANEGTWAAMEPKVERVALRNRRAFQRAQDFYIRDINVQPFSIPHDAADPVGYVLTSGKCRFAMATDMGYAHPDVLETLKGCQGIVLESNHDEEMLRRGKYPARLKQRILGRKGHLSNATSGELALKLAQSGTRALLLAHLSRENNLPELAFSTVSGCLSAGQVEPGKDIYLQLAPADGASALIKMG
ncbi:MBL fold metallo-hydrolase [Christensenellaceae bacterium NSJ-44]|uniref:MBL fold metallo-hydrolase n=1 Tax=Luoshenia tenuis TaxID=2763654 RepID=A0A926D0Z5_9FIRM|nr:MBL fold metallo-hydrolase [Luoshenia tenuis]MBC8529377.1 MBL fold metallo-hydrolase [Luoshenia tenuis]